MLSRRLLRIKVMQALYALRQSELSNQQLALDAIAAQFQPDLNSMEPQNLQQLEGYRRLASLLFEEGLNQQGALPHDDETPHKVWKAANEALLLYRSRSVKERDVLVRQIVDEVRTLDDSYYKVLLLLVELAHVARLDRERVYADPDAVPIAQESSLDRNRVIRAVAEFTPFDLEVIRRGISWQDELPLVRKIFQDNIKKDEVYQAYCRKHQHTDEEEQQLVQHLLRNVLLKQDPAKHYFEETVLHWAENSELIRSMAIKTLKSVQSPEGPALVVLTDDWEEDKIFIDTLYRKALENDDEYEQLLAEQLVNWDVDRVAFLDKIILKLALAELLNFPNIPVKVTINEYIELAKNYSTPKSGKFVNGLLDNLSEKLKASGKLRKSGRGLMDNR
ncbi:transcription antitermination factor NusB [Tellurirhabdus rosea]|uniref:transcription antitermination factor NusB n=1 Tax=Tellurirhabdus rosea TaxID=2674997 RepID=UPI002259999D|nr:transcription antitermination factor NusB [Tellurirhabdus rosea]